jgi:hypothetical protein
MEGRMAFQQRERAGALMLEPMTAIASQTWFLFSIVRLVRLVRVQRPRAEMADKGAVEHGSSFVQGAAAILWHG